MINFRSKTVCTTCNDDDDDDPYFSSYAHFGIHEEMLKVRRLLYVVFVQQLDKTYDSGSGYHMTSEIKLLSPLLFCLFLLHGRFLRNLCLVQVTHDNAF